MRQRIVFLFALVVMVLALAAPAGANGQEPVGGCPTGTFNVPHPEGGGWNLEPNEAMVELDVGNKADQNGDGYICQRFNIGLSNKHGFGVWTVKDNNNRVR
jgi:hypothetical protein